jgi:hypothetical protein
MAGFAGYMASIIYFGALNELQGRSPFYTVATIGGALFARDGAPGIGPVIAYNGLHLVLFILVGVGAALVLLELELHPAAWYAALIGMIIVFLFASTVFVTTIAPLAGTSVTAVFIGNLVAAAAVGGYLGFTERGLARKVARESDPEIGETGLQLRS